MGCRATGGASAAADELRRRQAEVIPERLLAAGRNEGAVAGHDGVPLPVVEYALHGRVELA